MTDLQLMALVAAAYLVAGIGKGIVGLGLPTVTMALLVQSIGLAAAVALTVVPTLVTNVVQAFTGGRFIALGRRLWPLLALAVAGCTLGTTILANADTSWLALLLGCLLVLYAIVALATPPLPKPGRFEPWLAPPVGFVAGLMAGMVGSFTLPGVAYLQSLRLQRDELVQALGVVFLTLSITLGVGLNRNGLLDTELLLLSAFATLPALIGMEIGRRVRFRIPEAGFRRVFLIALLALGLNIVVGSWRSTPSEEALEETTQVGAELR